MKNQDSSINIWLVGNITQDTKINVYQGRKIIHKSIGGSVAFAGSWFALFQPKLELVIFSVGAPKNIPFLSSNIRLINQLSKQNSNNKITQFMLIYQGNIRNIILKSWPNIKLSFSNLNNSLNYPNIIFLIPVYREISVEHAEKFRLRYPNVLLVADLQGWSRKCDEISGEISNHTWIPSEIFLDSLDIIKV